jgi:hypothetical protein
MARFWANIALLSGLTVAALVGASRRTPSLVLGAHGQPELARLASLEHRAAVNPSDLGAVTGLARSYLDRGDAGLALAVLQRSGEQVAASATASDLAASVYLNTGHAREALASTRQALALCADRPCEAGVVSRSARREGLLEAVIEMGVEDVTTNPEVVELAYRRTIRPVRIAMN